jgi:hypothetical protein
MAATNKTCDPPRFAELGSLTRAGFALYEVPQGNNLAAAVNAARK